MQPVQSQSLLFEISKSATGIKQPSNILEFLIIFIHGNVILKLLYLAAMIKKKKEKKKEELAKDRTGKAIRASN